MIFLNIFTAQLNQTVAKTAVDNSSSYSIESGSDSSISQESSSSSLDSSTTGSSQASSAISSAISSVAQAISSQPAIPTTIYKNGTYSASANYPYGNIAVTIVISNDSVTSLQNTITGDQGQSRNYSSQFRSGISGEVVGKKLNSIDLISVSGSSLTTEGFMSALNQIRNTAKN
jgi:uncharacterized protein with FMN-binding domain